MFANDILLSAEKELDMTENLRVWRNALEEPQFMDLAFEPHGNRACDDTGLKLLLLEVPRDECRRSRRQIKSVL